MEQEPVFQAYQDRKIAIYGLSPLTETLLKQMAGCQILGLLDGYRTSGTLYGQPILSIEEAIRKNVQLIMVAARPESCKIIAKRIGDLCREHAVVLLDTYGNDLCAPKKPVYNLTGVSGISKEELRRQIDSHDVVSTDFFDTLLMRRTLFPTDVFEIVDLRLRERGIFVDAFPKKRLEAEKELGKRTIPTLLEIYRYMVDQYSLSGIQPEGLAQLEWETDRDLVVPRKELCAILEEAYGLGKPVYIVSDTVYTKEQVAALLKHCGFNRYTDIFSSCAYRTGKTQRLFEKLQERIPGKTCLHIGDSMDTDIEGARQKGLSACQLYSGLELFEKTNYFGLWDKIHSLSSRIQAGMFLANLFNSPFQFEEPEQRISVDDAYDLGYLFLGPVMTGFVIWLYRQVEKQDLKTIWFSARDGYLIKKLYDQLDSPVNSVYFLTSRFAAIRAGLETEDDIRYVEEMRFSGSLQEELQERFGVSVPDRDCAGKNCLMDFKEELLNAARVYRNNYHTYLQRLDPASGDIAFFDFAARGTVQMYIQRLAKQRLRGFYFLQMAPDSMRKYHLDILPFYEKEHSGIFQCFYALETIVTAPHPPVLGFDALGEAIYAPETRGERDLSCVRRVQEGIIDYFQTYQDLDPAWKAMEEKSLEEGMLCLLSKLEIRNEDFLSMRDDDPFFNRTAAVRELL